MLSLEIIINEYSTCAKKHGEATLSGEPQLANECYEKLNEAKDKLFNSGEEGRTMLLELLTHQNESVRLWSATHCLRVDEYLAEKALKELSESDSFLGFSASMVIEEHSKGNL